MDKENIIGAAKTKGKQKINSGFFWSSVYLLVYTENCNAVAESTFRNPPGVFENPTQFTFVLFPFMELIKFPFMELIKHVCSYITCWLDGVVVARRLRCGKM
jgi:hypothetical protein